MPALRAIVIFGFCIQMIRTDCPRLCECKWKSGKESVACHNANLSSVPLYLEAGTQFLVLTKNHLTTIKNDEFSQADLLNLQKIYITDCQLKNIERYAFRNLKNLVDLDLSYNLLTSVPSHTFDSVSELRELKLNGNPIQRLSNDAFVNLPQLVRIELSDCRINTIEVRAFIGLEKALEWLKLDNNQLVQVASNAFINLDNLRELDLAGNPWNCSCGLRPLREWMHNKNLPFGIPPVCEYPDRLNGKAWDRLDLDEFACVPEIFAYESKTQGVEGKNVTMTCRISGVPEPSVRWLLKNRVIANLSGSSYANGRKLYMVHLQNNSSDLTIFSADLQDAGTYTCAAENKAGKAEASVTLAVARRPAENRLSTKVIIVSAISAIIIVLVSCVVALCVCSVRKKQLLRWRNNECRREDNYEKIEMNHKVVDSNTNGGAVPAGDVAVVTDRMNGEYRVVPDTDQEGDDEEENASESYGKNGKTWNDPVVEKRWNSPEHLLDPDDLHIPRRTLQEARDDLRKNYDLTCGTFNQCQSQNVVHQPRRYGYNQELSSLYEDESTRKFPDLLENSSTNHVPGKANSEGGSVSDIAELFCTLPRKRALIQSARYRSSDSQSPLLPDSRYGSSGGDSSSYGSQESNLRRASVDSQRFSSLNRTKISNSYLNLIRPEPNSTPLLDVSNLEERVGNRQEGNGKGKSSPSSYDYHAAQLERFLEEYRCLQKQLSKMKETCDNLRQDRIDDGASHANPISPTSLEDSIDFKNFESELTRYLLAKNSSPKNYSKGGSGSGGGGVFDQ